MVFLSDMRRLIQLLSYLLLAVFSQPGAADFVSRFERFTIEQGLSQNTVTAILEDSQGFIWFGTREGLNRFDGYQFRVFRHQSEHKGSISDNYIWSVFEDDQGIIWVGTANGGLNRFDRKTERFQHFTHDHSDKGSLSDKGVRSIYQDSSGNLWIGTNAGGLNRFDRERQSFEHWLHSESDSDSIGDNRVYDIVEGRKGELWLGTAGGVSRFDIASGIFTRYVHDPNNSKSIGHNRVRAVLKDGRGRLWFGTDGGGLQRLDNRAGEFRRYVHNSNDSNSLSSNFINALHQENADVIWVGTWGGGLNRFEVVAEQFSALKNDPSNEHSLGANLVYSLFQDSKGVLWVGTSGGGVSKFDSRTARFGHIRHQQSRQGSISDGNVRAILKDSQGSLWIGTRGGGLHRKDKGSDKFIHYSSQPIAGNAGTVSLVNNQIYTLFEDSFGVIWIGTAQGLNAYERSENSFRLYQHQPNQNSLSDNRVKHIVEQEPGILWLATHGGGVNRFNSQTGEFEVFRHRPDDTGSLSHDIVTYMALDNAGVLWVATLGGGLNRFDSQSRQFEHFRHSALDKQSLSHDRVFTLHDDADGNLWVGTARGLNRFVPESKSFDRIGLAQGLASEVVLAVLSDNRGDLWISGNHGLSRYDVREKTFRHYDAFDGLQSNEFNLNAAFKSTQGELFFGGINGFNRFFPQRIIPDKTPPKIHLTNFLIANEPVAIEPGRKPKDGFVLTQAINAIGQLILNDKQHLVTFEFAALDYANPAKNQYAYRLHGWDDDWVKTTAKRRFASYTKLAPGDYVFEVKAANKDGAWNAQGKQIQMTVLPPWYKTWWANGIYILSFGGIMLLLHQMRIRTLQKRALQLEDKVQQRTQTINQLMAQKQRMFANISHEFKTPLTLILNPLEHIVKDPQSSVFSRQLTMIRRNAGRLLNMVEQLLELSKLEALSMDLQHQNYSLNETLEGLLAAYQPLFDDKQLVVQKKLAADVILHLTQDALEMILGNLLSNAIKYTPVGGRIVVMVQADKHKVLIAVSDSGVGIKAEDQTVIFNRFTRVNDQDAQMAPGAGIGLALVKELVEANRGSIGLVSEPGRGSTFTVTLPLGSVPNRPVKRFDKSSLNAILTTHVTDDSTVELQMGSTTSDDEVTGDMPTVLMIDDNKEMLALLFDCLGGQFDCISSSDPKRGLELAKARMPDIVICDVMMPKISGYEVLKQLKNSPLTNHIPVILLTAKGDLQSRMKGWSALADDYLDKPFNSDALVSRIEGLLAIRSILAKRYRLGLEGQQSQIEAEVDKGEVSQIHQPFLNQVYGILEQHYAEAVLDVSFLADKLSMSQRQLGRKLKAVLDHTPTELIRVFRLQKAAELLNQGEVPSSVAQKVGFTSHSYFSQCFKAQFDCLPSHFQPPDSKPQN